jgi:hypothetical protein
MKEMIRNKDEGVASIELSVVVVAVDYSGERGMND